MAHGGARTGNMLSQGRPCEERDGRIARTFSNRRIEVLCSPQLVHHTWVAVVAMANLRKRQAAEGGKSATGSALASARLWAMGRRC